MKAGWSHGWNIVIVSLLFQAVSNGTIISSFALFMPLWSKDFGIAHHTVALFLTASILLSGVFAVIVGRLFDVMSIKLTVLFGTALYIVSFLLLSRATQPWQLFVLFSIALSLTFVLLDVLPAQVLVARWFGRNARVPLSIVTSGMAVGGVLIPPVVAYLVKETGSWRTACQVLAAVMAVLVVPAILLVVRDRPTHAVDEDVAMPGHGHGSLAGGFGIALDPRFYWMMLTAIPLLMMTIAFQANLGTIVLSKGGTLTATSFDLSMLNALGFLATISAGWMMGRLPHRLLLQIGAAVVAIGVLGFYLTDVPLAAPFFSAVIGLGSGATSSIMAAYYCLAFTPARMGTTMGLALLASRPIIFAPLVFAFVHERTGTLTVPMIGLSCLALVAIACATRIPRMAGDLPATEPEPALA